MSLHAIFAQLTTSTTVIEPTPHIEHTFDWGLVLTVVGMGVMAYLQTKFVGIKHFKEYKEKREGELKEYKDARDVIALALDHRIQELETQMRLAQQPVMEMSNTLKRIEGLLTTSIDNQQKMDSRLVRLESLRDQRGRFTGGKQEQHSPERG